MPCATARAHGRASGMRSAVWMGMRSLLGLCVAIGLFACQSPLSSTDQALAADDTGGGDCFFTATQPATLATYASGLQQMWTSLQAEYNAAGCGAPVSWGGGCSETAAG